MVRRYALPLLLAAACSASTAPPRAEPTPTPVTPATTSAATTTPAPFPTRRACVGDLPTARLAARVVAVPVLDADLASAASEVADGAAGVLLLGSSPAPADLARRVSALRAHAPAHVTPLVMADEEGGGVQRVAPLVSPVPWPREMAATMTPAQVRALAARVGRQLRAAGVSVDLAPVADVDARPGPSLSNPDGRRSFSGDPATAAAYTVAFLRGLADGGVLPVVKHFPGLGGTTANTDLGPAATLPLGRLGTTGLVPFRAAVAAGAPAVMVANASVPGLTSLPATLAPPVVEGLLRGRLGFRGLVVTDSLSAGAVLAGGRTLPAAVVGSVAAGADLVLFGSTLTARDRALLSPAALRRTFSEVRAALVAAVADGRLPRARLVAAATAVTRAAGDPTCG